MVIWLIGLSGSGKTTLGTRLKDYCDKSKKKTYLIDGDSVRAFFKNDLGYSREDRMENIKRIILAAYVLSRNDIIVIVCNIAPFEELRRFSRERIPGYNEIYLKKDVGVCVKADVKKMYRENMGVTEIAGLDVAFDEPLHSDLVVDVENETVDESLGKIIGYFNKKYPGMFA